MRNRSFAFRSPPRLFPALAPALAGLASCLAVCWTGSAYSASDAPSADMPLENKISICYRTKDDQQRLKCYDTVIQADVDKYNKNQDVLREEWHGNGLLTTRPFHMSGSWEFQWDSKGQIFQVMLYHKGESSGQAMPNLLANQTSGGPGSSYVDSGGDFYLVVNAMGPWSAKAVLVNQ
jgi:hypothetical protein